MNPKAPPWFAFHYADYLADTLHLSPEQHGIYLLLIIACWDRCGSLPDNDAALAVLARVPVDRWLQHRPIIAPFFKVDAGIWSHKRVSEELAKAQVFIEAGRRGAAKRWGKRALTVVGAIALLIAPLLAPHWPPSRGVNATYTYKDSYQEGESPESWFLPSCVRVCVRARGLAA